MRARTNGKGYHGNRKSLKDKYQPMDPEPGSAIWDLGWSKSLGGGGKGRLEVGSWGRGAGALKIPGSGGQGGESRLEAEVACSVSLSLWEGLARKKGKLWSLDFFLSTASEHQ